MNITDFACIPCLPGAGDFLKEHNIDLTSACSDTSQGSIRNKAEDRIKEAIRDGSLKYMRHNEPAAEKELLAYPMARIMVSCINNNYLTKRYALAVSKMAYEHIKEMDSDKIKELASELGSTVEVSKDWKGISVKMHFTEYVALMKGMQDAKWKLLNRETKGGYITVTGKDMARMLEERVRSQVEIGLPMEVPKEIKSALKNCTDELAGMLTDRMNTKEYKGSAFTDESASCFPPCINAAIADVKANINLTHTARFAMTAFLLNIGAPEDRVISLFNTSPDFKEDRTRYQVGSIKGQGEKGYVCPSCATMSLNNNCPGKSKCQKIKNPLVYYRRRLWVKEKKKRE